jgi:predicted nucleic acid-binding protein
MSTVVVDSSAFVDTIAQPLRRGGPVLECLEAFDDWWAPECFDAEVAQGLRHQVLRGALSGPEFIREMRFSRSWR